LNDAGVDRIELEKPKISSKFETYNAERGMDKNPNTFFHTKQGVNQYWTAHFKKGKQYVGKIRIKNRPDSAGERLRKARVEVDGKTCGSLPNATSNGAWYDIRCNLYGENVKVVMTQNNYLHFAAI
jgi:hypothetical protein